MRFFCWAGCTAFFGKWVRRDKTETVLRGLLRLQSMFGSDKKEAPQLPQPSTTFDWILTIRSRLNSEDTPTPAYGQVEKALRSLTTEPEQLIILWQQNPNNADAYWFMRCSVYARSKDNDIYAKTTTFILLKLLFRTTAEQNFGKKPLSI